MRKLVVFSLVAMIASTACGGSGATQNPGGGGGSTQTPGASTGGGGGDYWSGGGSARVTIGGTTVTLSPGGCYDGGSQGVDFRFGAWATPDTTDWVMGIAHSDGSKPEAISGQANGKLFVLDDDRTATIGSDGNGTFSGTDTIGGNGRITGTFSCH